MSSLMRELWSDPEFLRLLKATDVNGKAAPAPTLGVKDTAAGHEEIARSGNTQNGRPTPRPPASDTIPQAPGRNGTVPHTLPTPQPPIKNGRPVRYVHPGDGEIVSVEEAFKELGRKSGIVLESGSQSFHKEIWQKMMGKEGEPPIAFKYAGRIRLDVMRLTPEQFRTFQTLEQAQRGVIAAGAGIKAGGGNPGGGGGGDGGNAGRNGTDTHQSRFENADTRPMPSNNNGKAGGNGRPASTQVGHPPPPPQPPAQHPPAEVKPVYRLPLKPGDGEVVSLENAFKELGKKTGLVTESGSHAWHRKVWNEQLGKPGEPPVAYKSGGMIRIDIEKLTPQQLETFINLDKAQKAAIHAGTGGRGSKVVEPPTNTGGAKPDAAQQGMHSKVKAYDDKVQKFQEKFDGLQKKQASAGASKQLAAERAALQAEQKALVAEGEALSKELVNVATQELQAAFRTADSKELLKLARGGLPGRATVGMMAGIAVTLAAAYFIAVDIRYILDADDALEALERAGKVGANYAVGTAEFALFKVVTGSNLLTAVLTMVVGMCGDQANSCEAQEEAKRQEAEEKQRRENGRAERKAIGDFLAKNVPGSVMWVEDEYKILNQKVWDETVKKVAQMQKNYRAERKTAVFKRAQDLGKSDAKLMGKFVNKDDLKLYPEIKEHLTDEYELFEEYKKGFKDANKKRETVMHRATELGYQDGKLGTKAHYDDMVKWPEVGQLLTEGANPMFLYKELAGSYNDAFDIKTGKKDQFAGLHDD